MTLKGRWSKVTPLCTEGALVLHGVAWWKKKWVAKLPMRKLN